MHRMSRTITSALAALAFASAMLSMPAAIARPAPRTRAPHATMFDPPPNALPGIDVSHYQQTIDWTQVAASGVRFAIAKASEGTGYVDPMFATNRAGALAAGIVFGAYHFARPDLHPFDPIPEADHFVDAAQLAPGNIIPVLDLERSGSLTPSQISDWVLGWLDEVTARTGVRPMVYTSPLGWANRTGDTTAIADAGYTVLWVAHWNVAAPTLPANDWQGNGWTFWQYSDCGHVPGIAGCVDLDWFNGVDFAPVVIPSPDTSAPVATLATPTGVIGPVTVSFSEIVHDVSTESLVLQQRDTGVPVASTIACSSKVGQQVDCAAGNVIVAVLEPEDPLVPGQSYAAIVNPGGAVPPVVDRSGNIAATTEVDFAPPIQVEQASDAVHYDWRTVSSQKAFGRSYRVEHLEGAAASFAFTGKTVTWFTVAGPSQGRAAVWIDGKAKGTFDQYAPSMSFKVARSFRHLPSGEHTITVRVLGQPGSTNATDAQVSIDAFQAGGNVIWNPVLHSSWRNAKSSGASGGSVAVSDLAGSAVAFTFFGSGVEWHTVRGPHQGRAQIYVDGALVKTVDNYASAPAAALRSIDGLVVGVHQLTIVVLGDARPAAAGTEISIDAFAVSA